MLGRRLLALGVVVSAMLAPGPAAAEDEPITIESLLSGGWAIAGYTGAFDERSAFILFRHPDKSYLVQCRAGYDVTRTPREISNCYELR